MNRFFSFRLLKEWKIKRKITSDYKYLKKNGVETQPGFVTLIGKPIIHKYPNSTIKIDSGVTLISNSKGNVAGVSHPVILATMKENAIIHLRKDCGLSGATLCAATKIELGEYAGLGVNVCVYDTDFHPLNPYERKYENEKMLTSPILIDDFAWIGGNSIVLKGVTISRGGILGAGSVLTKDIPELCVFAGNPAKFIKKIDMTDETYNYLFNPGKE